MRWQLIKHHLVKVSLDSVARGLIVKIERKVKEDKHVSHFERIELNLTLQVGQKVKLEKNTSVNCGRRPTNKPLMLTVPRASDVKGSPITASINTLSTKRYLYTSLA